MSDQAVDREASFAAQALPCVDPGGRVDTPGTLKAAEVLPLVPSQLLVGRKTGSVSATADDSCRADPTHQWGQGIAEIG